MTEEADFIQLIVTIEVMKTIECEGRIPNIGALTVPDASNKPLTVGQISLPKNESEHADYERIEKAIQFICDQREQSPSLGEIAKSVHLSEYHFQKMFTRWAGISPKKFMQFLNKEYALELLRESNSILQTSLEVGLSSPGRLHDLMVSWEAATPGEIKSGGAGITIYYGVHNSPFGLLLIAQTQKGICKMSFCDEHSVADHLTELQNSWHAAIFIRDESQTASISERLFPTTNSSNYSPQEFKLLLRGTPFQLKVWEALLSIPFGQLHSYDQVAKLIDRPKASRAVGTAIASNEIAYLIPCHRVIRKVGESGQYRWGPNRKSAIIGWEAAQTWQHQTECEA